MISVTISIWFHQRETTWSLFQSTYPHMTVCYFLYNSPNIRWLTTENTHVQEGHSKTFWYSYLRASAVLLHMYFKTLHRTSVLFLLHNVYISVYLQKNKAVLRTAISPAAEWQWSGLKIQGWNWWPSNVTLTLSLHCRVMGSAHHLTKTNIWPKFDKHLSKGSGDMEWTWNSRLKLVTFNCDLDLESACLSYGFCTSLH